MRSLSDNYWHKVIAGANALGVIGQMLLRGSLTLIMLMSCNVSMAMDNEVVTDAGNSQDFVYAGTGNDVLVYTPSMNKGMKDYYDGGKGIDTLWLRMSEKEFYSPTVQADLIRFYVYMMLNSDIDRSRDQGSMFQFNSFNLDCRNIENVMVERINTREEVQTNVPAIMIHPVNDSSTDSLI